MDKTTGIVIYVAYYSCKIRPSVAGHIPVCGYVSLSDMECSNTVLFSIIIIIFTSFDKGNCYKNVIIHQQMDYYSFHV